MHDVHGNVWEWCLDWYGSYRLGHREGDGLLQVPEQGARGRVFRGSSFHNVAFSARPANRNIATPVIHGNNVGCRPVARVITE
ncbi:MAG: SUMF1/EgtB/PvdO family nonheme iron enzyme [Planctomycetota bacterium]